MGDHAIKEMDFHELQNKLTVMEEAEHTLQTEVQELRKDKKEHNKVANELADAQTRIHNLEQTEVELRAQMSHMENVADSHKETVKDHASTIDTLQKHNDLITGHLEEAKAEAQKHENKANERLMLADMHKADAKFHKAEAERHKAESEYHQKEKQELVRPEALQAAHAQLESLQARANSLENENAAHKQNVEMEKNNA